MLRSTGPISFSFHRRYPAPRRLVSAEAEAVENPPVFQPDDGPISENVRLLIAGITRWAQCEGELQ